MSAKQIYKGMGMVGAGFQFLNTAPTPLYRRPVQAKFFSAFFDAKSEYLEGDIYQLTEVIEAALQLPQGKAYNDVVGGLKKSSAELKNVNVGSFGLAYGYSAKDIKGKVNPVTKQKMTEEELFAELAVSADKSWDAMDEAAIAQLLTADTSYTGGYAGNPSYNWYTIITGASRPAATSMNLNGAVNHISLFMDQVDRMKEEADIRGQSVSNVAVLAGSTFFDERLEIEIQQGLARDLRSELDLASQAYPELPGQTFRISYFDSRDGIRYIRANESIGGSKVIGVNDAYLVPTLAGESLFTKVYAPAVRFSSVNQVAQEKYVWEHKDDTEMVRAEESNVLYVSKFPTLIRKLTV